LEQAHWSSHHWGHRCSWARCLDLLHFNCSLRKGLLIQRKCDAVYFTHRAVVHASHIGLRQL
jgi:hypothetical protein